MATVLSPSKITDYFPPSPQHGTEDSDDDALPPCRLKTKIPCSLQGDSVENLETSAILTPEHTPTKDLSKSVPCGNEEKQAVSHEPVVEKHYVAKPELPDGTVQCNGTDHGPRRTKMPPNYCNGSDGEQDAASTCSEDSASTTVTKAKVTKSEQAVPRSRKAGRSKTKSAANKTTAKSSAASTNAKKNVKKPDAGNKKLTDYFPVRRSSRMTSTEVKKQEQAQLEEAILSHCTDGLEVVDIDGKGRGVVARKLFKRGDFVVEYEGDLIEMSEAKDREGSYSRCSSIGCYMYYFNFQNKRFCLDATAESGKMGRLLNHSRHGNCCTKVVAVNNHPHLILVAAKDIEPGVELLYDYGDRSKEALEAHPWLAL